MITSKPLVYPTIPTERCDVAKNFQVGDLVFTKMNKGFNKIDSFTVLMQKIAESWSSKKNSDFSYSNYTHVAIVVEVDTVKGRVLIAEAMPTKKHKKDLRIVDLLSDTSCHLEKNKNYSYEIVRLQDTDLTSLIPKTVEIAKKLAERASYLIESTPPQKETSSKKSHFSFWNAVKAIFSKTSKDSAKLNTGTTKRIFKQIYDQTAESTENNVAAGGSKPRKFFCASFVAYLLQASEADAAWRQMKEKHPELEKTLPNFSDPKIKKPVSKWAKNMAQQHGRELNDLIKNFRFDAKKTGPGALRAFFSHKKITSFSLEGS